MERVRRKGFVRSMSITKLGKPFGSLCAILGLLASGLFLGGCASEDSSSQSFAEIAGVTGSGTNNAFATPNGAETLHTGDPLFITFSDLPNPPPPFTVRISEDGTITLLWNQTFIAAGKTRGELEREIRGRYVPQYYRDLTVTITQPERWYFVSGEVKAPNRYPYVGTTTILKAIASAGDFTDFAKKNGVKLTRTDGSSSTINCLKARGDPRRDLPVYPGDTIFVPRRTF